MKKSNHHPTHIIAADRRESATDIRPLRRTPYARPRPPTCPFCQSSATCIYHTANRQYTTERWHLCKECAWKWRTYEKAESVR